MGLSEFCIRRPVATILIMVSFVAFGLFAYRTLPIAALPQVDFPTIQVTAVLPGGSPETMAASVAGPLERQLSTIAGITSMTSSSVLGSTSIVVQFDLNRSIDGAALDVQSAISAAQKNLPVEMTTPPSFRKVNPSDQPILLLALTSDTLPLSTVDEYGDVLIAPALSTLPGVAQVLVFGAQKHAVRIRLDPEAAAARGLSTLDVRNAIAKANSTTALGTLAGPNENITLDATGSIPRAAGYRPLAIAWRNGSPVRLEEIATVLDSVENDRAASWYNDRRTIVLAIQKQPDANTVGIVDTVLARLPALRAQLPAAISLEPVADRSLSIRAAVADVQFSLILAIALVVMVIFLFLRSAAATIIPALALPVSLIGTFAGMWLFGFSLDNLSLMALTLSVGFVVDDAIVMLENIVRHLEQGKKPFQAALDGAREIGFTIVSMTLSLIAVFIPVLFMGGVVGRLFHEFAITISMAILVSGFVSLTLTPMLCARLLRPPKPHAQQGRLFRASEAAFDAVQAAYVRSVDSVLRHRGLTLLVTLATLAASIHLAIVIPKGFFPNSDTGLLNGFTEGADDIAFPAMAARQQAVVEILRRDPDVAYVLSVVGTGGAVNTPNNGRLFVTLKPLGVRTDSSDAVIQRLRHAVDGVTGIRVFLLNVQDIQIGGRPSKSLYQFTLQAADLDTLFRVGPEMAQRLSRLPLLQDVTSDLQITNQQARVDIDRDRAAQLGLTVEDIRSALYDEFGTRQISTIYTPTNAYQVILEAAPRFQEDAGALSRVYFRTAGGLAVPLEAVGTVQRTAGPLSVNHQGQQPAVTISFNLAPGVALGDAVAAIETVKREAGLPETVLTSFQGSAQVFLDSLAGQGLLIAAAVLVIYIVLGILYESFIHPITILSGLPSAGIGALLALMAFRMDLSVIALIGIAMLIGIVKKNAIMMVDVAVERRRAGMIAEEAIREACRLRFRPIMMTTLAAIFGTLPIALGGGAGSELRQPLGVAVVGGLLLSQLLTLYITPVIYLTLEGLSGRRGPQATAEVEIPRAAD